MNTRAQQKALAVQDNLRSLPGLPPVLQRVRDLRDGDRAEIDLVCSLYRADAEASRELLRIVNSSYYGVPRTVTTVKSAVELLGADAFRSAAFLQHVFGSFPPAEGAKTVIDRGEFWRHALLTAALARFFAARSSAGTLSPEQAFRAGLSHDLGKLVLENHSPAEYAPVVEMRRADPSSELWMYERLELGLTHAYVSSTLLGRWEAEEPVRRAVEWHHAPSRAEGPDAPAAALLHYCDYLAHRAEPARRIAIPIPLTEPDAPAMAGLEGDEAEHLELSRAELNGASALFAELSGE